MSTRKIDLIWRLIDGGIPDDVIAEVVGCHASYVRVARQRGRPLPAVVVAARNRERMKARHADPEFAARHRERGRERMKALNADPEFAARHRERSRERMKALNADPEFAARNRERMKARHADPEFAARHRERMKALHADPEFAARRGRVVVPT